MKTLYKHLIIITTLMAILLGWSMDALAVYTVNVAINNSNYGSVTISGGTTVSATRHTYTSGQTCTVKVTINSGYYLRYWHDGSNARSYNLTYSFEVTSNSGSVTLTAYVYPPWNGTQTTGSFVVANDVTLTSTVTLTGNLYLYINKSHQIKRNFNGVMFQIGDGYKLTLRGHTGDTLYIDGGGVFSTQGTQTTGADARTTLQSSSKYGLMFNINNGEIDFHTVVIQNGYNKASTGTGHGCGFWVNGQNTTPRTFKMVRCVIRGLRSDCHAAAYHFSDTNHEGLLDNCRVYHNYATAQGYTNSSGTLTGNEGGIIRCGGATGSVMTFNSCDIYSNTSEWSGGGISWYGGGTGGKLVVKGNTKIHHNRANKGNGGGINCGAVVQIESADVYDNYASSNGGGIYVFTYGGPLRDYNGNGISFTMNSDVKVHGNTARVRGGGIAVTLNPSDYLGFDSSNEPITAANAKSTITIASGAELYGNSAGQGGGIYVQDQLPYRYKNSTSNKWSNELQREVKILGGDIYNNKATDDITSVGTSSALGGAVFLYKLSKSGVSYSTATNNARGAGTLNVTISGGNLYGNTAQRTDKNGNGGAIYILDDFTQYDSKCYVTINGSPEIYDNTSDRHAGAIGLQSKKTSGNGELKLTVNGGTIGKSGHPNKTIGGHGGGVLVMSGNFVMTNGTISYNKAQYSASADNGGLGGAVFVTGGSATVQGGTIDNNTADKDGGGFYVQTGGTATINGGTISNNHADNGKGGGFYVDPGAGNTTTINSNNANTVISGNQAQDGGAAYVNTGSLVAASTSSRTVTIQNNTATVNGGGIYAKGTVTVTGATISGNHADNGLGGGLYALAGSNTITVQTGASITGNHAVDGAGVYAASGNVTIQGNSTLTSNVATNNGGGIFANGGTVNVSATANTTEVLAENSAVRGGAVYANGGIVNISDGVVARNYASEQGGGFYIPATGKLTLKGTTTLTRNHVPSGKKGGGVYLAGVVEVGSASKAASTIIAEENYSGSSYDYVSGDPAHNNRNNIYLPNPVAVPYTSSSPHVDVITVVEGGLTNNSSVGFSVPHNFVPVIYCAYSSTSRAYLDYYLSTGSMAGVVFEDSEKYSTMHSLQSPYDPDHIYLSNQTWVQHVTSQPASGFAVDGSGNVTISTKEGLAWLISYVNGLNGVQGGAHNMSGKTVTLTADVDMDEYSWVPIGFSAQPFNGTFDGNGHTVSNINCIFLGESGATQTGLDLGMFGNVGGSASISDVFLENAYYSTMTVSDKAFVMGGLAARLNSGTASVSNSGAQAEIETSSPTAVMGGLVGQVTAGTVHSSYALPALKGYQMGGLVGSNAGDLYNSFANASFTYQGSGYAGGLAGVNSGTVENCYMRLLGAAPVSNFGYLVGDNTGGTINYSYSPVATYTVSGKEGSRTGLGTYTATTANAYDYKVHDNQVSASNSFVPTGGNKQLVTTLNNWVKQDATHETSYTKWLRTTSQVINGDYPLLRMPADNAVSATNGDVYLYYGDINTHLTTYKAANQAICLYGSRENVNTNIGIGTSAPLYIDQDAVITQTGDIQAYVGVTLDNSAGSDGANPSFGGSDAIDWHFFSSALTHAPIGLVYGDEDPYGQYQYPTWEAYFDAADGYFPTNLDSYYDEWDLYAYYEPDYHWINLKRNSASHWHEDWPDIHIYPYTNDTEFVPGRGYMVALAEDNYLQAYGTLNNNSSNFTTVPVTCTSSIGWTTREGHNLLGNPYQSYLDFEAFVRENESLWNEGRDPFYIIIDEDKKDYVLYTVRQSPNPQQASRFLHPHQGFMIDCDITGTAKFDNSMRTTTTTVTTSGSTVTWPGDFRGVEDAPCYPLVNLMATDANGNRDIVTVELGRPDKGGALKQDAMHSGKGSLWCRYEGEDYALVFTQPGLDAANIRFATDEDAEFTMTWSTHNGAFSYLHLIDNITGADIDCLSDSEYKFSARESDYNSRFRLVFDYTGIEENGEDGLSMGSETFAYYANGEIHLTDADDDASLQIIDMTGRVIVSRDAARHVSTNGMAPGVYVLRLTTANGTRTQKIVLN